MKKLLVNLCLLILLVLLSGCKTPGGTGTGTKKLPPSQARGRTALLKKGWAEIWTALSPKAVIRMGSMPFDCGGCWTRLGETVQNDLRSVILSSEMQKQYGGKLRMLSRDKGDYKYIIGEMKKQQISSFDEASAVTLGKLQGATHLLMGKIEYLQTSYRLTLYVVEVESGSEVASVSLSLPNDKALENLWNQTIIPYDSFDDKSLPFYVLVGGTKSHPDKSRAEEKALLASRVKAAEAMKSQIIKDVKSINTEKYSLRDGHKIRSEIEKTITKIQAHVDQVINESTPYEKTIYHRNTQTKEWEAMVRLKIHIVEVLPKRAMDSVLAIANDRQAMSRANQLINAFDGRGYHAILSAFYSSLIRRFRKHVLYYYDYAKILSEKLNRHQLAIKVMERGLKLVLNFSDVGGKTNYIALMKTFEKRLYNWKYYRHQMEDILATYKDRDSEAVQITNNFSSPITVTSGTELGFTLSSKEQRTIYLLWFDRDGLGFVQNFSGITLDGTRTISLPPGTIASEVLLVMAGGKRAWNIDKTLFFHRKKVDKRDKTAGREVEKIEKFLDSLARYLKENQGVTTRVEFEQRK